MSFFISVLMALAYFFANPGEPPKKGPGKIAFASDRNGSYEVFVMNRDGSDQRRLELGAGQGEAFSGVQAVRRPRWSPDGKRLAIYAYRQNGQDVIVANADGGSARILKTGGYNTDPEWSPDGRSIVFRALRNRNWGLYVIDANGANERVLADTPLMDRAPHWSPDGKRVVFCNGFNSKREGGEEIYVVDIDGANPRRLTNRPGEDSLPRWSPDGKWIAFNGVSEGKTQVFIMAADGSGLRQVTFSFVNYSPAWSPDGKALAYTSIRDNNTDLFRLTLDGGEPIRLTDHPGKDSGADWLGE